MIRILLTVKIEILKTGENTDEATMLLDNVNELLDTFREYTLNMVQFKDRVQSGESKEVMREFYESFNKRHFERTIKAAGAIIGDDAVVAELLKR